MKVFVSAILLGFLTCATAWGQATAQMHGTVKDASGAAVPGADVKATQTDTGLARNVMSGAEGEFVLTNLPLGPYQIEVSKEGFTKYVQSGIVLQVNSDAAVEAALKVGAVTDQVVVEANAAQVETRSSGIGEVVQTQRIVDLPLNGRNVTDLITLAGGSVNLGNIRSSFFANLPMISIAGQASSGEPFGTDYTLDGGNHVNFMTGTTMPIAFPDAVQEFKVESSGQTASHGSAAAITVVTRSGSNDFHGNLFEFIRNSAIGSAREYFSASAVDYKRNQYGGTIGGPIKKNKLFFFGGFQGTAIRQNPDNALSTVPTASMLAGDWTAFSSAACNAGVAKTLKTPFGINGQATNTINPAAYSGPAVYIADKVLGSLGGVQPNQCGVLTYNIPDDENYLQFVGKVDYQLNDKQSVFFRLLDTHNKILNSFAVTPDLLTASNTGLNQLGQSYAIGHTFVVSSNVVQSFRAEFDRTASNNIQNESFDFCQAGLQNFWCGAQTNQLGGVSITGGFSAGGGVGGSQGKADFYVNSIALNDDVNWVKGNHQIALGGGVLRGEYSSLNDFAGAGQFTFNGSVTGLGMADYFVGSPSSFFQGLPNTSASRQNFFNLYATDSWRVVPRLTFNFGIRWEPYLPMSVSNGQISNFDMNRFLSDTRSTVFLNAPYGFYFPGDPGFPGTAGAYKQWDHFDPRGGLAWDPKGDGKMSIRAGYAYGYAYIPGISRQDQGGSNPWGGRSTFAQTGTNFANPYAAITGGNPYPYSINPNVIFTQAGQYMTSPYNLPTPTTYSWNLSVQRQIGATWILSSTYIGSRMQHLAINQAINYAEIVGTIQPTASLCPATSLTCSATSNTQARRVLSLLNPSQGQFVGNMDQWQAAGTQIYNGLLTSVQKRFNRGISANANWTWSHCIGVFQGYDSKSDQTSTVPNNLDFDRGNCDSDRRHIVNITIVGITPKFSNHALRLVASDWQISGIYRFTSGMPISIQDGSGADRELTGINHQRPNQILPDVYTGLSGPGQPYLNIAAFAQPCGATLTAGCQPLGTFGSLGWNSIVGPTYWDVDLALSRIFRIREKQSLEVRADAFNLTNSFVSMISSTASPGNAAVPSFEAVNSNLFGINTGAAQPTRKIQFALKYAF